MPAPTPAEVQDWIVAYLAKLLDKSQAGVDPGLSFDRLGLDSVTAVILMGDLESWLGVEIDPTLPYDHPTIASLASKIATLGAVSASPP